MFEATLKQASLLKKILEAIKDLVTDANFDCSAGGIALQAMDSSHVSLVALLLRQDGFEHYRCDRNLPLGINLGSMYKIVKCAGNDDKVTMESPDKGNSITFTFENQRADKISEFALKLMNIESETLTIPESEYAVVVSMPASEFQRICRDLSVMGDTVVITATKEGVKFSVSGDIGNGSITCKPSESADSKEEESIQIDLREPVSLTFALRYLNFFTKATSLAQRVSLSMSVEAPLAVEYSIEDVGYLRYYLAPKIEDEKE